MVALPVYGPRTQLKNELFEVLAFHGPVEKNDLFPTSFCDNLTETPLTHAKPQKNWKFIRLTKASGKPRYTHPSFFLRQ